MFSLRLTQIELLSMYEIKMFFAILPIAIIFGKSLIFQLGPRLERLALPLENKLKFKNHCSMRSLD